MQEKYIHRIFDISVIVKGIDGALEGVGGILLLFIKPEQLIAIIRFLTQRELTEDPQDIIVNYLLNTSHRLSISTELFLAIYLLIHGLIKIIIVIGLLKNKVWAYPLGIIIFSAFVVYQLYQFAQSHTLSLIILTIFDVFVILLTWHEYRFIKKMMK